MFLKWLPWKYVVRRVARNSGFVDPISVLARLHSFAEPAEVTAPLELLRAGVVFHARGLMNASCIQHNRDWIWPLWVERQFDPENEAFLPRAFSMTHVNLTHRNWTAVGLPGCDHLPIVDPRGLLTPYWDGWSIDGWVFQNDGVRLIPARIRAVQQQLTIDDGLAVTTESHQHAIRLRSVVEVVKDEVGAQVVHQHWEAESDKPACLVLSVRPYNPEGVSFVHEIRLDEGSRGWHIGQHGHVRFSEPADQHFTSDYRHGDVAALLWNEGSNAVQCDVGMATAAAVFALQPGICRHVSIQVPLNDRQRHHWMGDAKLPRQQPITRVHSHQDAARAWEDELKNSATADVPDERFRFLHDAALRTVVLHCPGEVYPGPYTYKRFWVRDAAFILNAALCTGLHDRVAAAIPHLLKRQDRGGYFHSQDGEWDANGEALWLLDRYLSITQRPLPTAWTSVIRRAAKWIQRKRVPRDAKIPAAGLLPAGFSAEHLGPNDYYYWDDFWAVAGLRAAGRLMRRGGDVRRATDVEKTAEELEEDIQTSLTRTDSLRSLFAYPAAPERRMDAGAIGSLAASYPLQLVPPEDSRMQGTIDFLMDRCMVAGGFFQNVIHSGINPYLTLHMAQVMMRAGDSRSFDLINVVAKLASSTGQWPEAIHPATLGGCMGDGQHVWAAAEWLMAIRNLFVREEGEQLLLGTGIPAHWHYTDQRLAYGPTWTPWGRLQLEIQFHAEAAEVSWQAAWHERAPKVTIAIPCFEITDVDMTGSHGCVTVRSNHICNRELVSEN